MPGGDEGLILENNLCGSSPVTKNNLFLPSRLHCAAASLERARANGVMPLAALDPRCANTSHLIDAHHLSPPRWCNAFATPAVPDLDAKVAGVRAAAVACSLSKSECSRPPAPEDE